MALCGLYIAFFLIRKQVALSSVLLLSKPELLSRKCRSDRANRIKSVTPEESKPGQQHWT